MGPQHTLQRVHVRIAQSKPLSFSPGHPALTAPPPPPPPRSPSRVLEQYPLAGSRLATQEGPCSSPHKSPSLAPRGLATIHIRARRRAHTQQESAKLRSLPRQRALRAMECRPRRDFLQHTPTSNALQVGCPQEGLLSPKWTKATGFSCRLHQRRNYLHRNGSVAAAGRPGRGLGCGGTRCGRGSLIEAALRDHLAEGTPRS